jgi:uridine phosphorylase
VRHYEESELILNPDGSVFHLHLLPGDVHDDIILVGDPGRVDMVAGYMTNITCRKRNREFYTVSGEVNDKPITVISTGIGTDNIDIVLNELDALVNIDLEKRQDKPVFRSLNIIRIGTSGAIQPDIVPGTFMSSALALGFDGLLNFYHDRDRVTDPLAENLFVKHTAWDQRLPTPYICSASDEMLGSFEKFTRKGITISANGFYGPQGRNLRANLAFPGLNERMKSFKYHDLKITNFEMEGSAIYGLSQILGHKALTVCLIIANRESKQFLGNYQPSMRKLIELSLDTITKK